MINLLLVIILTVVTAILFVLSFFAAFSQYIVFIPILFLIMLGISIMYYDELCVCCDITEKHKFFSVHNLYVTFYLIGAGIITYILSTTINLGPVVSAALVGLIAGLITEKFALPAYCGAFVGMVSQEVSQGYIFLIVAGLISSLIYISSERVFIGFGGKLGTIAFIGCLFASIILGRDLLADPLPQFRLSYIIILYSVIAGILTYYVNFKFNRGPVIASSLIGLLAGIFLPIIHPAEGAQLAVVVICASFAGMSSKQRLPNVGLVALAGLFSAVIYILSSPHFGGAGGKLGTIAFASTLGVAGLYTTYLKIKSKGQKC